jgi:hypothetical protein
MTRAGGPPVEVDAGIAPLIEALWALGIETVASCEDGGTSAEGGLPAGLAWIGFPNEAHAGRFCGLSRTAIVGAFALDAGVRGQAQAVGLPPTTWLATFPSGEIGRLAALARAVPGSGGGGPWQITDLGNGLRRNDPCWCGSAKKFKRCHGG